MPTKKKQAPPPTCLKAEKMKNSTEMYNLINALPPSVEKDNIKKTKQYKEWNYHVTLCFVKKYTHIPTQEEKMDGFTLDKNGKLLKLYMKAKFCRDCKCSAQVYDRHRKTKKCMENRKKGKIHFDNLIKKAKEKRKPFNLKPTREKCYGYPNIYLWIDEQKENEQRPKVILKKVILKKKKIKKILIKKPINKIINKINKLGYVMDDHYKILDCKKDATPKEIKQSYRALSLLLHPDRCKIKGGDDAMKKVNKAYELLNDVVARKLYDDTGQVRISEYVWRQANHDNF